MIIADSFPLFIYSKTDIINNFTVDNNNTYTALYNITQMTNSPVTLNKTTGSPKIAHSITMINLKASTLVYYLDPDINFVILDDYMIQLTISSVVTTFSQ